MLLSWGELPLASKLVLTLPVPGRYSQTANHNAGAARVYILDSLQDHKPEPCAAHPPRDSPFKLHQQPFFPYSVLEGTWIE